MKGWIVVGREVAVVVVDAVVIDTEVDAGARVVVPCLGDVDVNLGVSRKMPLLAEQRVRGNEGFCMAKSPAPDAGDSSAAFVHCAAMPAQAVTEDPVSQPALEAGKGRTPRPRGPLLRKSVSKTPIWHLSPLEQ